MKAYYLVEWYVGNGDYRCESEKCRTLPEANHSLKEILDLAKDPDLDISRISVSYIREVPLDIDKFLAGEIWMETKA